MAENKQINDFKPLLARQCFTKAKPHFSEAGLTNTLDQLGILRPSMAATITKILKSRNYIDIKKGTITTTDLGIDVSDFLVESEFNFVDIQFTAHLEEDLDAVSKGEKTKLEVLQEFWKTLKEGIERGQKVKKKREVMAGFKCPKCDGYLLLKHSSFGKFYSCQNYKKDGGCDYKADVGEDGSPLEKKAKEKILVEHKCPKCKKQMVQRESKYGIFFGCQAYPKCDGMRNSEGDEVVKKKKSWKKKNDQN